MIEKDRLKPLPSAIGIFAVLLFAFFIYLNPKPLGRLIDFIDNGAYDLELRGSYKKISKDLPIAIVDIDDASLAAEGRWPWPRKKLADLVQKLQQMNAEVIAFDIAFPEAELNIAAEVSQALKGQHASEAANEVDRIADAFNYDAILAKSLASGNSILGFIFKNEGTSTGQLPPPLLTLDESTSAHLLIPDMKSYLANIAILQNAARFGGFINASPDTDGILRFSPILLRQGNLIYPSIDLEAARLFLKIKEAELVFQKYGNTPVVEGIRLGKQFIPTDPWGKILIPFRGPPYSISNISASDILKGSVAPERIAHKLVFIGSSATALGDLYASAIAPVFAGVEIHASIASGIIDHYLPFKPAWGKGVSILMILVLGILFALILPYLDPLAATLVTAAVPTILVLVNQWIWVHKGIVLSVIFPIVLLLFLYLFNLIWGYLFEKKRQKQIISIFGEYVPPEFMHQMLKKGGSFSLDGETKELTVLFADIRNFTTIAESMPASELKKILNEYLTPMTQVIFDHKGTIDKYVGDMIMAFWGAPLENLQSAYDAVSAALAMQAKLEEVNALFKSQQKPEIRIGVGINTGVMNVGDMGSRFRRAYTVIGDAVNLASRLESICRYYNAKVIVGEETYKQTVKSFGYRKLDRVKVKGKGKPIDIFEPLCLIGQCNSGQLATLEMHNQAIELYFQQKWGEAESVFQKLLASDLADKELYQIYLDRIAQLRKNPPGPNWDCVYVFESK